MPNIFMLILGWIVKIAAFYSVIIALLFIFRKMQDYKSTDKLLKYAVIVPARNEEAVIGNLIRSFKNQSYAGQCDVFVVPNNCTDDTEGAARAAGAEIIPCNVPVHCKGQVLNIAFDYLLADERHYDAFCVFDADNIADSDFLLEINKVFAAGANVVKARSEVFNLYDSWISGGYGIYISLFNHFYNRPRYNAKLPAKLVGSGFAVSRALMEKLGGWHTTTIAEDAEFAAQCALANERVYWAPRALALEEAPNNFVVCCKQRRRWSGGVMQVGSLYLKRLAKHSVSAKSPLTLDIGMMLLVTFTQVIGLIPMLLTAIFWNGSITSLLLWAGALAVTGYLGLVCAGIAAAVLSKNWSIMIAKAVLMFPIFMASWLPLAVYSFFKRPTNWDEIPHTGGEEREAQAKPTVHIKAIDGAVGTE